MHIRSIPSVTSNTGNVTPPPYFMSGDPGPGPTSIDIKDAGSLEAMRRSCRLAKDILDQCGQVEPILPVCD